MSRKIKLSLKKTDALPLKSEKKLKKQKCLGHPWKAKVITLYPEMFPGTLAYSVIGRALKKNNWSLEIVNLRDFGIGKHKDVDDKPSGGGPGMILRADVLDKAIVETTKDIHFDETAWPIINLSPRGHRLTQKMSKNFVKTSGIILICGRFEGIDQRVIDKWKMQEISLGDFIISGGEIAAQALIDSIVRNIPNVLGNSLSIENESFNYGMLEHPQFTRPSEWNGRKVPEVLLSGNHQRIQEWKNKQSEKLTKNRRPDLIQKKGKNYKSFDN